jgi:hypothetical protein
MPAEKPGMAAPTTMASNEFDIEGIRPSPRSGPAEPAGFAICGNQIPEFSI